MTTWNSYDSLNRPASISYSDTTPAVAFTYDSVSSTNGKGRLTAMSDGAGSESYHYDSMGRVTSLTRVMTGGPTLTSTYTWNLLGSLKEAAFPGIYDAVYPLTIFYDYDNAGRQKSAWWNNGSDYLQMVSTYSFNYTNTSATNYAQEITNFSNGTTETVTHDIRLQPVRRTVTPAGTLDFQTVFAKPGTGGNNGNVWAIDDLAVAGNDQDFTYDYLNRITGATGPGTRSLVFTQDRYGNKSQTGTNGAPHKPLTFTAARNRMNSTGYSYDNAGNLTAEPLDVYTGRGAMTYAYDGENRIKSTGGSGTATYSYDGQGRRVKKVSGGTTRYYFYDPAGNPVWEYAGLWETFNLYFNGKFVFTNTTTVAGNRVWVHSDHLGTPRVKTNLSGGVIANSRLNYHPYGELVNPPPDAVKYKFTANERDSESNLDYFGARYYGSSMGRFVTTDPLMASAHARDPQTWNKFSYTFNNPLRFVDPDGMDVPDSCAKDANCTIIVKVNVIYDKSVNNGKGLTDQQKKQFERNQIAKAAKDFAASNIKLDVSYTAGSYTIGSNGKTYVTGLRSDSLNLVASTATPTGVSGVDKKTDIAITYINVAKAHDTNAFPLFTNTTQHEFAHQFLGDVYRQKNPFSYVANEFVINAKIAAQAAGISQQSFRDGLKPRRYAVPANPEANKPQQ